MSLYINCYNLQEFKNKNRSTGVFNAYTYLYSSIEENQDVLAQEQVTINCLEKQNKKNPHYIKNKESSYK